MKQKRPLANITQETNVNLSIKVPSILDIEWHYSKKKHARGLLFFDPKKDPDENDETCKLLPCN